MIEQQLVACYESRTCLGGLLLLALTMLLGLWIALRAMGR